MGEEKSVTLDPGLPQQPQTESSLNYIPIAQTLLPSWICLAQQLYPQKVYHK